MEIIKTDLVVVGGGPAGICAAVASSRSGVKTFLVEKNGFLGGTATIILAFAGFKHKSGEKVVGGISEEIVNRMKQRIPEIDHFLDPVAESITPIEPEVFKIVNSEIIVESGVNTLLHTFFTDVIVDNNKIKAIIVENKSGKMVIEGKIFIDCTGDGDLAARSGVPYKKGDFLGNLQPVTMTFRLGNFNNNEFVKYIQDNQEELEIASTWTDGYTVEHFTQNRKYPFFKGLNKIVKRVEDETGYMLPRDRVHFIVLPIQGQILINTSRIINIDGTNVYDLSRAEFEGRKQVFEITKFLKDYVPGFKNSYLIDTSAFIGVRETRRICGLYELSKDDVINGKRFDDDIARGTYPIDIHSTAGRDMSIIKVKRPYGIPYRCIIPLTMNNLLMSGRCLSASREALGSVRVIPTSMATGEAAGTAGAMSIVDNLILKDIDIDKLRKTLKTQNVVL